MAAKSSSSASQPETHSYSTKKEISKDIDPYSVFHASIFLERVGVNGSIPEICQADGFYADFFRSFLKVDQIQRGRITYMLSVKPQITNIFQSLHGGALAAVVELMSIDCARTVVTEDKELFLGEMSLSYLSAAPENADVLAAASVVKSGRNLTVIALDFKMKITGKLIHTARCTFYNMPAAKL